MAINIGNISSTDKNHDVERLHSTSGHRTVEKTGSQQSNFQKHKALLIYVDKIPTPPSLPYYLKHATHVGEGLRILLRYKINNLIRNTTTCTMCNNNPLNLSYHIFFKCEQTKCFRKSFFQNTMPIYYLNINLNSSSVYDVIVNPRTKKTKTSISVVIPTSIFLSSSFTSPDIPMSLFLSKINKFFYDVWNFYLSKIPTSNMSNYSIYK